MAAHQPDPIQPDPIQPDPSQPKPPGPEVGPAVVVDARGLRCPLPVIRLAQAVRSLPDATRVIVLATDPAAAHDVPAWCRLRGHRWLGRRDLTDGMTEAGDAASPNTPGDAAGPTMELSVRLRVAPTDLG
jgi:tRNA 2-thiouridine synthesizing protein A